MCMMGCGFQARGYATILGPGTGFSAGFQPHKHLLLSGFQKEPNLPTKAPSPSLLSPSSLTSKQIGIF